MTVSTQGITLSAHWPSILLGKRPLTAEVSLLARVSLLTFGLAAGFAFIFRRYFPSTGFTLPRYEYWSMGLVTALAFLGSIRIHELASVLVGRLTSLWRRRVIEADQQLQSANAGTEFMTGLAGLAVSLVLSASFLFLADVGSIGPWWLPVQMVLGYLAAINALILMFHILPAFPLDGGRVVRSLLWMLTGNLARATYWASLAGQGSGWILTAIGLLCIRWNWLAGTSLVLVGLCLNAAARSSCRQQLQGQAAADPSARAGNNGWKRAVEVAGVFLGLLLLTLFTT